MRRPLERARHGVSRAHLPHEGDVVGRLLPHRRRPGTPRLDRFRHRGQRLVVHGHESRGIHRLLRCLRHHEGQGIADVPDPPADERRPRRGEGRRPIAALAIGIGRQVAEAVGGEVIAGEHGERPRRLEGGGGVDAPEVGMRVHRAYDHGVDLPGQVHVVGIAAESLEEMRILQAVHGLAHRVLLDCHRVAHVGPRPLLESD